MLETNHPPYQHSSLHLHDKKRRKRTSCHDTTTTIKVPFSPLFPSLLLCSVIHLAIFLVGVVPAAAFLALPIPKHYDIVSTTYNPQYHQQQQHQQRHSSRQQQSSSLLYATMPTSDKIDTTTISTVEELMAEYDPILLFASRLLPPDVAKDAGALYAWCRRLDEICDDPDKNPRLILQELNDWESRLNDLWAIHNESVEASPPTDDKMDAALWDCIQRRRGDQSTNSNDETTSSSSSFSLTKEPFQDMITGMRSDTVVNGMRRVATMAELEEYGYQVAGTVGLMLLPLLEAPPQAKEPAKSLGKAIQLINILRDASPDVELGRIYLPQDLLRAQGVSDAEILSRFAGGDVSKGYRAVVKSVSERAYELLLEAEIGKTCLPGLGPLLVQIIIELYRGYLVELEQRNYNNLTIQGGERVKISKFQKLGALLLACRKVYFS